MSIYRGKNKHDIYLASILYDAIEDQDFDSVKTLLSVKGADPNLVLPKQRISSFHLIIGIDSDEFALKVTQLILIHGGNPNVRSDEGLTPMHIAAAWGRYDILKLLLNCGGDPQIRDCLNKTPLYYACEEGFPDCVNLLKEYLPDFHLAVKENDNLKYYDLVLEKICISNGYTVGEYEIVNEYKTDSIHMNKNDVGLNQLPESSSNEYIIDWFNKNLNNITPLPTNNNDLTKTLSIEATTESSDVCSAESSPDESDNENNDYSKARVCKINKTKSSSSPKPVPNITISECEEYSKESGISAFTTNLSSVSVSKKNKQETSSDYVTCSSGTTTVSSAAAATPPNILEMNIFDITEESLMTNDDIKSQGKSEGIGSELSFVSVSEVYKYVDKEEGIILYEQRFLKSPAVSEASERSSLLSLPKTIDYDSETLRKELTILGYNPGPITVTTKRVYLKKLRQLTRDTQQRHFRDLTTGTPLTTPIKQIKKVYTLELEKTINNPDWSKDLTYYQKLEEIMDKPFKNPDMTRKWREGCNKSSFTYLLLDPRITNNLPCRINSLTQKQIWETFLSSIFYVGKGKRSRPYKHLYEAIKLWQNGERETNNKKLNKILDIWNNGNGVVCLHVFQNVIPVEAYTREAAMISALKLDNLCNDKMGNFYGNAVAWPQKDKKMLGVYLLYKAMKIFLNEGERQLRPNDID